jgi:Microtubule associated protein (MAP65/ASE1 family)
MKKMSSLEEWERNLCDNLGTKPYYICKDPLPDEDKLRLWSLELAKQQDEYEKRVEILRKKRSEIKCLLGECPCVL